MTGDEKRPTIRRDMRYIYERVERAHSLIDRKKNREAWNELDLAIRCMQGLSFFMGPWEDDSPPEDPNKAAKAVVDRVADLTEEKPPESTEPKPSREKHDSR